MISSIKKNLVYILIIFLIIIIISLLIDLFDCTTVIFIIICVGILIYYLKYVNDPKENFKIERKCLSKDVKIIKKTDIIKNYDECSLEQQVKNITCDKIYQKILMDAQKCQKSEKTKEEIDKYNNDFFNFRNYTEMNSNGVDPVDKMNDVTLTNNDFKGCAIADIYNTLTSSYKKDVNI